MIDRDGRVLLVEKLRPDWQKGKLNGIGGKFDRNEDLFTCMRREWAEETGSPHHDWNHVCSLNFTDAQVHFFRALVETLPDVREDNDVGERLIVADALNLPSHVIPNLKWLIPLCLDQNGRIGSKIEEIAA